VEGDRAWITIELSERPRLSRILVSGVSKTHETELKEKLDLIKGRVVTDAIRKNAELTVRQYFIDKGYLNVEVNVVPQRDSVIFNGVALNLQIDKKSKVKINRINIYGNEAIGDSKLKSKMKKTNEKLRFHLFREAFRLATSPKRIAQFVAHSHEVDKEGMKEYLAEHANVNFLKTSKFKKDEYKEDKKKFIGYYNSKGYRDATIVSDSIYAINDRQINIDFHVEEGQKYYFRNITWTGNFVHSEEVLNRVLGVQKGDVYDMELIEKKLTFNPNGPDISSLYMDNGYLFFSIVPVEVKVEHDSIDIEMRIYEGERTRINRVIIQGNDRTNDHVVRRELRTIPGDYFSRELLIRTQRELSQLGYFDPEQIGINPIPNMSDGTVDIEYSLVERPSDQVELSGGWGGFYGFVGTVGLVFNNFSLRNLANFKAWKPLPVGDGQRLQLRLQANGKQFQNYSLTFTEPWLGGRKPNSFTVGANHSVVRTLPFINIEEGTMQMTTMSMGIGKRLKWPDDYFTLSNTLSMTLYNFDNFQSSGNQQIGFSTGTARNLMWNITLARNSIDNPMFPRAGSNISLSLSLTPPYSLWRDIDYATAGPEELYKWVEYHKWMFDATYYQQVIGKLVFSARAHLGMIGTYTSKAPTGPFDRFQMGGAGLSGQQWIVGYDIIALRGYEDLQVTPPGFGAVDELGSLRGGVAYNKFVFELRYPVTTSQASTIFVLGFAEAGNNFHTLSQFNPFTNYRGAGFGARIFMPAFGLLGIDWAYGFDALPGRGGVISGSQFHFSIGQQFR
jgi:outer membrane protein insertion porin family